MTVSLVFYSAYGHMYRMIEAAAEGVREIPGSAARLFRVPETLPPELLEKLGIAEAQKAFAHVPVATLDDLAGADALIFGVPTRFGNMSAQMRAFLDSTGPLYASDALVGKVASAMSSSATQHGGQETTLLSTYVTLMHLGMIIVGLPYSFKGQSRMDEITGGSPYGASTITGQKGARWPSENELAAARYQGRHVALIASRLVASASAA
jgi:NAD(P)H dehydrogenase (quinone)